MLPFTNYHKYNITFNTNTGINTGTGDKCNDHSYDKIDVDGKAVSRDESLTEILISKGVQEVNLITAIVSLGEGKIYSPYACVGLLDIMRSHLQYDMRMI